MMPLLESLEACLSDLLCRLIIQDSFIKLGLSATAAAHAQRMRMQLSELELTCRKGRTRGDGCAACKGSSQVLQLHTKGNCL